METLSMTVIWYYTWQLNEPVRLSVVRLRLRVEQILEDWEESMRRKEQRRQRRTEQRYPKTNWTNHKKDGSSKTKAIHDLWRWLLCICPFGTIIVLIFIIPDPLSFSCGKKDFSLYRKASEKNLPPLLLLLGSCQGAVSYTHLDVYKRQ